MSAAEQETNGAMGTPLTTKSKVLETGASLAQSFAPVKAVCAHLNAFHVYTSDPHRCVEANHYCTHLNEDVRQCLIYDSTTPNAKLIGVEYMISAALYATLDSEERKLWHSHVFEVKSGMLIMPGPEGVPTAGWEVAETKEMEDVVGLYGKTYHFWQVDRGDKLPLGGAELMGSFTSAEQIPKGMLEERDQRYGISSEQKKEKRAYIAEPEVESQSVSSNFLNQVVYSVVDPTKSRTGDQRKSADPLRCSRRVFNLASLSTLAHLGDLETASSSNSEALKCMTESGILECILECILNGLGQQHYD
ncbi:MAG: hypothetical protein Q9166_004130 [cf. Caloplaca sp. 2 TL-2023]